MDQLLTNDVRDSEEPVIFGLRYLEEEAAEIHDIVGCQSISGTCTVCSDDGEASELAFQTS